MIDGLGGDPNKGGSREMHADEDDTRAASATSTAPSAAAPAADTGGAARPAPSRFKRGGGKAPLLALLGVAGCAVAYVLGLVPGVQSPFSSSKPLANTVNPEAAKNSGGSFRPTEAQLKTITVEPVAETAFRTTLVTDGKIAIDEDVSTPVYSPYVGRVTKLLAKPGDKVEVGKPLFIVAATDMVQGQNDFLAAIANMDKFTRNLGLAEVNLKRQRGLVLTNAVAKRDVETAEIAQVAAVNDLKTGQVALEAARNRLRILGKSDAEISAFQSGKQAINAETTVVAPLSGTIVQRKVGPGQLINGASTDPVFVIGDLSTVWLIANVRETDATKISIGQDVEFTILALETIFKTKINYISASVNPDTHRLQVRAQLPNPDGQLRPEMFANVVIVTSPERKSVSVPRHAIVYEGEDARLWVVREDNTIELRKIKTGIASGNFIQVLDGLKAGERIVTKGSLFIDRLAAPSAGQSDK